MPDPAHATIDVLELNATFDHVAHAAPRIRSLLPLYRDVLGGQFLHGAANDELGYRTLQLAFANGTKIELLEPLPGSQFLDSFLARHPAGGMHHVTFRVDDLHATIAAAKEIGLAVFGVSKANPHWREAFIHPRTAHGVLVQVAQASADFPPVVPGLTLDAFLGPESPPRLA